MDFRLLGMSGLKVPVLTLSTAMFGGKNDFFNSFNATDVAEATRLVDICLEIGLIMFDSADDYNGGQAEQVLGERRVKRGEPDWSKHFVTGAWHGQLSAKAFDKGEDKWLLRAGMSS